MCGITGIWEYGATEGRVDAALIERMRDTMPHRGPDDVGTHVFDASRGGFGFRRLSIVDVSPAGHQPMTGCAELGIWLAFNGEIYNHGDLRRGLEERGHRYHSRTDSETIVHLYEERGPDFVNKIEGDFGIAIWDEPKRQLSLYRDRMGVKPLYYFIGGGRIIFGSEIKAILAHPAVDRDVDETALSNYLSFLATPAPQTLFKGIQKLAAGHCLIINGAGDVRVEQYWDALPPPDPQERTAAEHADEVLTLLRLSIKKRMMSDVPFGVLLSGGVDSSANVALMSELMERPVDTFTVGFENAEYLNELESARRIATMFRTNHHEVVIGGKEFENFLPELVFHQDEPIADPTCVPMFYVSRMARENGTIVVQVGEGADEIFSGYAKYVRNWRLYSKLWRYAERMPAWLRYAAGRPIRTLLKPADKQAVIVELARRLEAGEPMFWGAAVVFDDTLKGALLSPRMHNARHAGTALAAITPYLERIATERPDADFLSQMVYLELKLRLPELLLMRVDKITMATSVEARVPFLDHHLVEYAMGLPADLKVVGNAGKHILKRALGSVLPHDVLYAKKRGFGAPIREWFRSATGEELGNRLMTSRLRERDYFDYSQIAKMLAEHRSGQHDWSFHLWALMNLTLWYDRWIDND